MKWEYRIITLNKPALRVMGEEGWELVAINDGEMYFKKEIKKTREQKKATQTKEYLEFRDKFPSKNGVYADRFIAKYNSLVEEGLHSTIIDAIDKYKKELEVTGKPVANPETWINQKRYLQDFKVTKTVEDEWMNEYFEGLSSETIKLVKQRAQQYKHDHKDKSLTPGVLKNIIKHYTSSSYI